MANTLGDFGIIQDFWKHLINQKILTNEVWGHQDLDKAQNGKQTKNKICVYRSRSLGNSGLKILSQSKMTVEFIKNFDLNTLRILKAFDSQNLDNWGFG